MERRTDVSESNALAWLFRGFPLNTVHQISDVDAALTFYHDNLKHEFIELYQSLHRVFDLYLINEEPPNVDVVLCQVIRLLDISQWWALDENRIELTPLSVEEVVKFQQHITDRMTDKIHHRFNLLLAFDLLMQMREVRNA